MGWGSVAGRAGPIYVFGGVGVVLVPRLVIFSTQRTIYKTGAREQRLGTRTGWRIQRATSLKNVAGGSARQTTRGTAQVPMGKRRPLLRMPPTNPH